MTAVVLDRTDYAVLDVVALKKMATTEVIAGASGVAPERVDRILASLVAHGLVVVAGGSALPTDGADPALEAAAAEHYATVRSDPEVLSLVDKFETTNSQFLTAMSSWQQVDVGGRKVTNDHTDPDYDNKVISRLEKLITKLAPLLDALAVHDPRFALYPKRFDAAVEMIDQGRHEYVSSPTIDSVHNIWFEFHEDLLRTLGRERAE